MDKEEDDLKYAIVVAFSFLAFVIAASELQLYLGGT